VISNLGCLGGRLQEQSDFSEQLLHVERLVKRAVSSELLGDMKKVVRTVTRDTTRYGQNLHIGVSLPQFDNGFNPLLFRHKEVNNNKVHGVLPEDVDADTSVFSFEHCVSRLFQDVPDT